MVKDCSSQRKYHEAEKCYLVNCFKPARVSLKMNQRFDTASNVGDADAVTLNEKIPTSRNISLDEQHSQSFVERLTFKGFWREPHIQYMPQARMRFIARFNHGRCLFHFAVAVQELLCSAEGRVMKFVGTLH